MTRQQTIAGVVLTLNEEHDLPRALSSLASCDELLVVDSGSTDRTLEISAQYGARVVQHIQTPPFLISEQRNWALENADLKSDWVLFLDADEEISSQLFYEIRLCINSRRQVDAYELTPRYWFLGKWLKLTQGYPNWHPRLVKLGHASFQGGVWESFSPGSRVQRIQHPYEHYAFSKGLDDWLERHLRYATWDAQETVNYLTSQSKDSLVTKRWQRLRMLMSKLWFLRPPLRFIQKYIFHLGILEGWQALLFSLMMSLYDLLVVIKVVEILRRRNRLPL